jgi:hypothetical protein
MVPAAEATDRARTVDAGRGVPPNRDGGPERVGSSHTLHCGGATSRRCSALLLDVEVHVDRAGAGFGAKIYHLAKPVEQKLTLLYPRTSLYPSEDAFVGSATRSPAGSRSPTPNSRSRLCAAASPGSRRWHTETVYP